MTHEPEPRSDLERELGLSRDDLDAWDAALPPSDFADRVLAKARPTQRRSRMWLAAAAAILLAAGGWFWTGRSQRGSLTADARRTDAHGPVVWVAERGTELTWTLGRAGGRIEQRTGDVFYRVDGPTSLVVTTPAGDVRVEGTCFRVEVEENAMVSRRTIAGGVGAATVGTALGALVTVWVYEGRVALANDEGEVELSAGEAGELLPSRAPERLSIPIAGEASAPDEGAQAAVHEVAPGRDVATLARGELVREHRALLQRHEAQQAELQRLRSRLASGERNEEGRARWFPATQGDLAALAERCAIRIDLPPVQGFEPGTIGSRGASLVLEDGEEAILNDAIARVHANLLRDLRTLYSDASGADPDSSLSPEALLAIIEDRGLPNEVREVYRRLAQERAGLVPVRPDTEWSATERAFRRFADLGNELQATLAQSLGPARAEALRAEAGGWPWGRSEYSGCPDPE